MTATERRTVAAVVAALTPDLLAPRWRGLVHPLAGHCYVVAEALRHLLGPAWRPKFLRHEGEPHWFLVGPGGEVLDPTAGQFSSPPLHGRGVGKGFLTRAPSRRARAVVEMVRAARGGGS